MTLRSALICLSFPLLFACAPSHSDKAEETGQTAQAPAGVVNIYSSRHYDTDLRLYSDFTAQTGIEINRIEDKSNALIERLKNEGEFSSADLLITVDAGGFWRAEQAGILQPFTNELLETRIPAHLRHPEGLWYGLSTRARVIIFNKAKGRPDGLESYQDLVKPEFKGKICMRSSGNIYNISLLSSIIENEGEEAAKNWADGMVANFARKPQSNDTGQIEAVSAGLCEISLVNSYYLARFVKSDDPVKKSIFENIGIIFPNQDGSGTHINISGAALTAHAPNKDNAIKFVEYLTSRQAQIYFADGNNEYPVIDLEDHISPVQTLGTFQQDTLNVGKLGQNQEKAIALYDAAGWP